jgi:hypothetical protein
LHYTQQQQCEKVYLQKPKSVSGQPFYKFDGQEKTRQNPKTAVAWTPHSRAGRQILLHVAVSEQKFSMFEYTASDITATFNHRRVNSDISFDCRCISVKESVSS